MRILLVDDDQLIRFVHQMFIERAGHEVVGLAEEEDQAVKLALQLLPVHTCTRLPILARGM